MLSWVHWHNTSRLNGYLNDVTARRPRSTLRNGPTNHWSKSNRPSPTGIRASLAELPALVARRSTRPGRRRGLSIRCLAIESRL